jgi:hypothetical protein
MGKDLGCGENQKIIRKGYSKLKNYLKHGGS